MLDEQSPLPPLPKPREIDVAKLRDGSTGSTARAILYALGAGVAVTVGWSLLSIVTGYRLGMVASLAGLLVGTATRAGAEKPSWSLVAVAGVVTVMAMVLADYFVARNFLVDISPKPLGMWIGLKLWRATISPESIVFWTLGLAAAAYSHSLQVGSRAPCARQ